MLENFLTRAVPTLASGQALQSQGVLVDLQGEEELGW